VTELDLVQRAKTGDEAAMAELLSGHVQQAYRLALHILHNRADAEDATQNAFVKAFTELSRFEQRSSFATWLLRIVTREALNLLRADKTRFAFWQRQQRDVETESPVESIVLESVEHRDVVSAVNQLKTNDRLVLTLSYFIGLSEAEIAEAMGIRPGTVKWRKNKALARLRTRIEQDYPWLRDAALVPQESRGAT